MRSWSLHVWDMCSRLPWPDWCGQKNLALILVSLFKLGHKVTGRGWLGLRAQRSFSLNKWPSVRWIVVCSSGSHVLLKAIGCFPAAPITERLGFHRRSSVLIVPLGFSLCSSIEAAFCGLEEFMIRRGTRLSCSPQREHMCECHRENSTGRGGLDLFILSFFHWSIVASTCCVCWVAKWISHTKTYPLFWILSHLDHHKVWVEFPEPYSRFSFDYLLCTQ